MCLLCTGRRQVFCDKEANKYLLNSPGLTLEVANGSLMTGQARTLGVGAHVSGGRTRRDHHHVECLAEQEHGADVR
jgi:hypothetical protein